MLTTPHREALDRRRRAERGAVGLLERERVLASIADVIRAAEQGSGRALLVQGHAGLGKTRIHEAALDDARAADLLVLRGAGAELEGSLAFGVAMQLLTCLARELRASEYEALLAGAPEPILALTSTVAAPGPAEAPTDLMVSHALFSLLAAAAESRGVLVAIDDLQWCDEASLTFIAYLLHRLDELSVGVVLTERIGREPDAAAALDRIAAHPRVALETLEPLSADSVLELAERRLERRADRALAEACFAATSGNPFYVEELLRALGEDQGSTERLTHLAGELAPNSVARALRVRIGRLGPTEVALARAAAILGGDVPLRQAATLAGLEIEAAARAADRLRAIDVLLPRLDLQFVHPLVRSAVNADVPVSERASRHLLAARIVHDDGAEPERIAAHLLLGRATGDPWAVDQLRAAARAARARAAANSAVRYLERALEEPPEPALRPEILAELGAAEAALGTPSAADHLELAAAGLSDPLARAELALQRGRALYFQGSHEKAAAAYNSGLRELPEDPQDAATVELYDALQTGFVATATLVPSLNAQAAQRSVQLLAEADRHPRSDGQRQLLAQASVHALIAGEPAAVATDLAERAWDGGRLLEHETADGETWSLITAGFCWGGDLERCIEVVGDVTRDAERHASPLAFATASYVLGCAEIWQGCVDAGVADLETALDARRYGWAQFARAAAAFLVFGLIDTGEFARADAVLEQDGDLEHIGDLEDAARLLARAELRLARGRAEEALADAERTGVILGDQVKVFSLFSWRTTAAQAALAVGDRDRARELADTELAIAERTQILHAQIRALRVRGLCDRGDHGLDRLRAAVELGTAGPPRVETIRALVDLGAALRRSNQRAAAREPLQRSADLARRGGATLLYRRARAELVATGARPRREMLLGGPESLTASERRIAELAAAGQSNREIAQALFVTPKTVEYHLRNAYRKLDITTRHQLANALRE